MSQGYLTYGQVARREQVGVVQLALRHCPFCGGAASFREANHHWGTPPRPSVGVVCQQCKAQTPLRRGLDARQLAATVWNTRAAP